MPHAALWVVQHQNVKYVNLCQHEFQCRTRLCGWCNRTLWLSDGV